MMLPQLMKVTISPSENVSASAPSTKTRGPYQTSFIPTSAFWTNTCNVKKKNARFPQIVSYSCNYKRESKKETDNLWVFCYFLHPLCSSRDRSNNILSVWCFPPSHSPLHDLSCGHGANVCASRRVTEPELLIALPFAESH